MKRRFKYYLLIKIFYLFFGIYVFSKVSSLGDTERYTSSDVQISSETILDRTYLIDFIAGSITKIFITPLASHLFFCLLSFYGLYYCLKRLQVSKKTMVGILVMLSLPDFAMWTSVVGKESFTVFTTGIIMGTLFDVLYQNKIKNIVLFFICVLLSLLIRPHYTIGLVAFFLFVFITKKLKITKIGILAINIFVLFTFCILVYMYAVPFINTGGFMELTQNYFIGYGDAGAARNNDFWIISSDYYNKMFSGSFIALMGPTFNDSLKRPIYFPFFIQSLIFITYVFYYLIMSIKLQVKKHFVSQYFFFALFYVIILTAIMHYPFGVFNSGSALRYRSAFYHIFIIIPVFLYHYLSDGIKSKI